MKRKINIVEDEESLNLLLKKYLEMEGYEVTTFVDGNSALARLKPTPDLWILDIMLPDINGYELLENIKAHDEKTPIIFISAKNESLDRVLGLELGSNDYVTKPFLPRELVIRVKRILKDNNTAQFFSDNQDKKVIKYSGYVIDANQLVIYDGGNVIQLTVKEFDLAWLFCKNLKRTITREQILNNVWGIDYFGSDRVVDDAIRRLRKKLPGFNIKTIYGLGYRLVSDDAQE